MYFFQKNKIHSKHNKYRVTGAIKKLPNYGFVVKQSENIHGTFQILINDYYAQIKQCKFLKFKNRKISFDDFKNIVEVKRKRFSIIRTISGWTIEKSAILVWKTETESELISKITNDKQSILKQLKTTKGKQIIKVKDLDALENHLLK